MDKVVKAKVKQLEAISGCKIKTDYKNKTLFFPGYAIVCDDDDDMYNTLYGMINGIELYKTMKGE